MKSETTDLRFASAEALFEPAESHEANSHEQIQEIALSKIKSFPGHPYHVKGDESMNELVDSIKTNGLLSPILVRKTDDAHYELISGHRRKRAFELARIEKIPCRVCEMSRDEAVIAMVDSNLQRDEILPSEKAFAYKMRLEAMNCRPGRPMKSNSTPVVSEKRTNEKLGEIVGESREQIRRYIRLTELLPELLQMVDERRIALRPAVELSYLSKDEQRDLLETIESEDCTPSLSQSQQMRKLSEQGLLNMDAIFNLMTEPKGNQKEVIRIPITRLPLERVEKMMRRAKIQSLNDFMILSATYYLRYLERQAERWER